MKKILFFLKLLILCAIFVGWHNSDPGSIISHLSKNGQVKAGGLKYRVYLFGVVPVGEAFFEQEKIEELSGQKVYHLRAKAVSASLLAKIIKVSADLDSYVDIKTLNPLFFRQKLISPGKEKALKEISYDQKDGFMAVEGIKRQILPDTQDPLSMMLRLRRMDFTRVDKFTINLNAHKKNYLFAATARPMDISAGGNVYKLVSLEAKVGRQDKNPYHQSQASIFLLRQNENVPILIKIFASGILMVVKLVEIY